ncbi:cyclodeaminase/cyclohydrolase family protein [Deinococcus sp. KNUC1210]|uniref:cyclodeaminase/cyclohydrolase family protein n=1 Tax=Deinococcus sp. KNUC1210 TaxID=2917691 RepID=UPI001EEFCE5E|nr:cyclodeaminase/cyclohydrolase family protein [Deinococcus sp. KNUC1210]ULH14464.1 cyclodeaminase/cyclohydrolase family protein [Deinococcus sp. KNUC1210]
MPPSTDDPARSLWDSSARELLQRTASADPTPGGGSVAAISGAFGLALVTMALAVSLKGKNAPDDLKTLHHEAGELLNRLLPHPDADVTAFQGYMDALALPKSDEVQRASRRNAIQAAALSATEAPLSAARDLLAGLELAERAAVLAHQNVVSDVGAGAALLAGALHAELLTVDINLSSLPEEARRAAHTERTQLAAAARTQETQVASLVQTRLTRPG